MFMLLLFFFNDTATTEIYTLSLHDALPISYSNSVISQKMVLYAASPRIDLETKIDWHDQNQLLKVAFPVEIRATEATDRKSTRLNSSHSQISYAVFCLKKKKNLSTYRSCLS